MKTFCIAFLGLFAALLSLVSSTGFAAEDLPKQVWAVTRDDEEQDVIFVQGDRPVLVRFHVWAGDKGFRMAWANQMTKLWSYLDKNKDGKLAVDEYSQQNLFSLVNSPFGNSLQVNGQFPGADQIDSNPKDNVISIDEFLAGVRAPLSPFAVVLSSTPDAREEQLFKLLDANGDGELSTDDLPNIVDRFSALDLDDDEVIIAPELNSSSTAYATRFIYQAAVQQDSQPRFLEIDPTAPKAQYASTIVARFDNGGRAKLAAAGDGLLARCEIGLSEADFLAADRDRDAKLSGEEVAAWLSKALPEFEFRVNLPDATHPASIVQLRGSAKPATPSNQQRNAIAQAGAAMTGVQAGGFELPFENSLVALWTEGVNNFNNLDQFYTQQFSAADGDKSGTLERKEAESNGFLNQFFDLMDRDGDNKATKKELKDFVAQQEGTASCRVSFRIGDKGRSIYDMVDLNKDSRLSVRELRQAKKLLALDRDGDGQLAFEEVIHRFRIKMGKGSASGQVFDPEDQQTFQINQGVPGVTPAVPGAPWFHRMDRNRDGDVSRREFLGPEDVFRKIDADGDGLIDAKEAVAAADIDIFNP